jgi:cytoskeletal protein RodZ
MDNFGDQLKQERERRNVALDEIARSTKIRVRYLQALEEGQHERLPGIVFAKGYVRAYAETIGADADRLVGAYVAEQRSLGRLETEASQEQVLEALAAAVESDHDRASRRGRTTLVVLAILIAAAALIWFGIRPLFGQNSEVAAAVPAAIAPPSAGESTIDEVVPAETTEDLDASPTETTPTHVQAPTRTPVIDAPTAAPARADPEPQSLETAPEPVAPIVEQQTPPPTVGDLTIADYGVGTDVRQRVLVGEASQFETGTMVVFWNRVLGGAQGRSIRHVWYHEGNVNGSRTLTIGAAHWRTYSKQTLRQSGQWTVEAQDENGSVLARQTFTARAKP